MITVGCPNKQKYKAQFKFDVNPGGLSMTLDLMKLQISVGLIAHLVDGFVDLLALVVVDGFSD